MTGSIDVEDIADADAAAGPRDPDPRVPVLTALLAATPLPPAALEPEVVLDGFAAVMAACGPIVASLSAAPPAPRSADATALLAELRARERAWLSALDEAHRQVGAQLGGVRRARTYQRAG